MSSLPHDFGSGNDDRSDYLTGHRATDAALIYTRLDARISTFMATQTARDESLATDIRYLRESSTTRFADHESRIRILEARQYVTPKTIWAAFGLMTTIGSIIVAIIGIALRR